MGKQLVIFITCGCESSAVEQELLTFPEYKSSRRELLTFPEYLSSRQELLTFPEYLSSRRELLTFPEYLSSRQELLKSLSLAAASRVHPFCNLQSRARTHAVWVIGLYELLGNPTT
jgi:hypothetical protein